MHCLCTSSARAALCWQRILLTTNNPGAQVLQAAADARARALCYVWAVLGSLPARARAQGAARALYGPHRAPRAARRVELRLILILVAQHIDIRCDIRLIL